MQNSSENRLINKKGPWASAFPIADKRRLFNILNMKFTISLYFRVWNVRSSTILIIVSWNSVVDSINTSCLARKRLTEQIVVKFNYQFPLFYVVSLWRIGTARIIHKSSNFVSGESFRTRIFSAPPTDCFGPRPDMHFHLLSGRMLQIEYIDVSLA